MSIFKKEQKNQEEIDKKKEVETKEVDLDTLEQVSGGISLRDVKKVTTTDINDNTKSKI